MTEPLSRLDCLTLLFGAHFAKQLVTGGFYELFDATTHPEHPLMRDLAPVQRDRLRAVLRLAALWYREQAWQPTVITGIGDVVRLVNPRLPSLDGRVIWLLALDVSGALVHEVLVQMGGDPLAPPPLRTLLRHALIKGAVTAWIADYRPVEDLAVTAETQSAFDDLVAIGGAVGVVFTDWVLFAPNAVRSVCEQAPPTAWANSEMPEAA